MDDSSGSTSTPYIPDPRRTPPPLPPPLVRPTLPGPDFLTAWTDPSPSLFRSLPAHSVAGAFLPLRPSVHVASSPQWAVFDYGDAEDTAVAVAFCLHPDCKRGRATNPKHGLFVPAVEGSMNRHWRDKHRLFGEEEQRRSAPHRPAGDGVGGEEVEEEDNDGERGHARGKRRRRFRSSSTKVRAGVDGLSVSLTASAFPAPQPYDTPSLSAASTPMSLSSSPSSSSVSSSCGGVHSPPPPPAGVARRSLRARPSLLFARFAEVFSFFASFLRLQWGYIAERVAELSSANRLGVLVSQTHIVNDHRHRVTFQTAAGLISDNDGECPCKPGQVERITRARYRYQCIVRCAECESEKGWVLDTRHHYRLSEDLILTTMTPEEERAHEEREGYRRPFLPDIIPIDPRTVRRDTEFEDEQEGQYVEQNAGNSGRMQLQQSVKHEADQLSP